MNKQFRTIILTFILLEFLTFRIEAQNYSQPDSAEVSKTVFNFFDWYINAIKTRKGIEYNPQFVEAENGMTTLDFKVYFENLKIHGFSDTLIEIERQSYHDCLENLAKVKYSEFLKEFDDLDDFEATNCDFTNYYRWLGGQEIGDGIKIKEIYFVNNRKCIVTIQEFDQSENDYSFWKNKRNVTLIKPIDTWLILNIDR